MPSKNRVVLESRLEEWGVEVEAAIMRELGEMAEPIAEAAKAAEVREDTGALRDSIHALPPERTPTGFVGGIGASDHKAVWYELGTLGRRGTRHHGRNTVAGAAREQRRKSLRASGDRSGVKPLHFLRKGLLASRGPVFERIGRAMREARGL